ncbi:MAG: hypothetical protein JST92_15060 [Deltaproteobacteria bacterium]|nr:hypothetical protein [Deltaproteobacteria bacterium]
MSESAFPVEASPASAAPFTVGGALNETFRIWTNNLVTFALVGLPGLALALTGPDPMAVVNRRAGRPPPLDSFGHLAAVIVVGILVQAVYPLLTAKAATGGKATIADAIPALRAALPFFVTLLVTWILIGIGTLFLLIPGFILALRWALVGPVAILESNAAPRARSRNLLRDHQGTFILFGLSMALVFLAMWGVSIGVRTALGPLAGQVVMSAISSFISAPIFSIGLTVVYLQLKRFKEGGDTAALAQVFQ